VHENFSLNLLQYSFDKMLDMIFDNKFSDKSDYVSPQIEVLEVDVEKGFSSSDGGNESYEKEPGVWD